MLKHFAWRLNIMSVTMLDGVGTLAQRPLAPPETSHDSSFAPSSPCCPVGGSSGGADRFFERSGLALLFPHPSLMFP